MAEYENRVTPRTEPERVRGKTLREQAKDLDSGIAVVSQRSEIAGAHENSRAVILAEEPPRADYRGLYAHLESVTDDRRFELKGDNRATVLKSPNDPEKDENAKLDAMSAQIEAYPEALRPLLRTIIGDIRELRAVFPNKKFIGATVEMLRGGASGREPQVWHYDGTSTDKDGTVHDAKPRFTRILKTYDGPGVQIANQDQTKMMDAPTGSVAIYTSGLQGPLHRGPGLKPGEHRLRLFIELSE